MLTNFDVIIILLYLVLLVSIGVISARRVKSVSDFLVAGKRLGYGLYIPAMAAVVLGGASTFGSTALGYQYGVSGMWLVAMIGLGILGMGFIIANKLSDLEIFSVSELLAKRFGKYSRLYSAFIMVIYDMMVSVVAIIALGVMFKSLLNWNTVTSIIIGGAIVICYTMLGGMWAVTLTDVVQFWVMTIGMFIILLPIGWINAGGFSGIVNHVEPDFLNITNLGWKTIFSFFLLYFFGMMIGQDVWQRALTGKNRKIIKKGTIIAGVYCILYGCVGAVIGMIASVVLPGLDNPQQALPELIMAVLPAGVVGLVVAAIISAVMSTASGTIMASTTIIVNDFILPMSKQHGDEKSEIRLTRFMTLIVGIVAIVIASVIQDVVVALNVAYALLSGSIFLPVIAALFWKKVSRKVIVTSMVVSSIVVIIDLIMEGISSLNPIIYGIMSGAVIIFLGVFMSKEKLIKTTENIIERGD